MVTGSIDGLRRIVSPITLLLGVVVFLLPFCALSCNGGGLAPSGDLVSASGIKLAFGGDTSFNCDYINQLGSTINGAINSGSETSGSSSFNSTGPCSPNAGSTSTSSSTSSGSGSSPFGGSGNQKVGPFDGAGSNSTTVHVAMQPIALIAGILFLVGAFVAALKGRAGMLGGLLAAVAAAVAVVVLRITLNSSFNSDVKAAASSSSSSTGSSAFSISGFDPTSIFQLTWGIGWWLALVAAILGAGVCGVALAATGSASNLATVPAGGARYGQAGWGPSPQQYWQPPPQQPPYGQPAYGQRPPPFGAPPPAYGEPPQQPPGSGGYPPHQG